MTGILLAYSSVYWRDSEYASNMLGGFIYSEAMKLQKELAKIEINVRRKSDELKEKARADNQGKAMKSILKYTFFVFFEPRFNLNLLSFRNSLITGVSDFDAVREKSVTPDQSLLNKLDKVVGSSNLKELLIKQSNPFFKNLTIKQRELNKVKTNCLVAFTKAIVQV